MYFGLYILLQLVTVLHSTLGQLLETLIIVDRVFFLQKNGASVRVVCTFNREQSPRCMMIQAVKESLLVLLKHKRMRLRFEGSLGEIIRANTWER